MAIGPADKPLPKHLDQQRHTTKIARLPKAVFGVKLSGGVLTVIIALGGAVLGSLGSQIVAYLTVDRQANSTSGVGPGGAGTAGHPVSGLLSKAGAAADRLQEIEQALQNRDFGTALLLSEEGLRLYPGDTQFNAKRQRAEDEIQNRFRYQTLQSAITRQNFVAALALYDEIPAESSFKLKATEDLGTAREQYIAEQLRDAQTAAKLAQCSEAKASAQAVLAVDSNNSPAKIVLAECDK
jgi:hypothetical protein